MGLVGFLVLAAAEVVHGLHEGHQRDVQKQYVGGKDLPGHRGAHGGRKRGVRHQQQRGEGLFFFCIKHS